MGKKLIVIALAMFAFGFGSALRSNAGTEDDGALPRARAQLQLCASTAAAAATNLLRASSGWRRRRSEVWLLRSGLRLLRCSPILRATRLLASTSPLALTGTEFRGSRDGPALPLLITRHDKQRLHFEIGVEWT